MLFPNIVNVIIGTSCDLPGKWGVHVMLATCPDVQVVLMVTVLYVATRPAQHTMLTGSVLHVQRIAFENETKIDVLTTNAI